MTDKETIRYLEAQLSIMNAVFETIDIVCDGGEVSEFMLSMPIVRKVYNAVTCGESGLDLKDDDCHGPQ